jgi:hypothetical protein
MRLAVRMTRQAISPLFAMRIFLNTPTPQSFLLGQFSPSHSTEIHGFVNSVALRLRCTDRKACVEFVGPLHYLQKRGRVGLVHSRLWRT